MTTTIVNRRSAASTIPMCTEPVSSPETRRRVSLPTDREQEWMMQPAQMRNSSSRQAFSSSSIPWHVPLPKGKVIACLATLILLSPWIQFVAVQWRWKALKSNIAQYKSLEKRTLEDLKKLMATMKDLEGTRKSLEGFNKQKLAELRLVSNGSVVDTNDSEYEQMEKYEEDQIVHINGLEEYIQKRSRMEVEKKYGKEPYRVEISLNPKKLTQESLRSNLGEQQFTIGEQQFTIEMAPLSLMPHSVHHFLRMVSSELWNGLAMVYRGNDPRLFRGTPMNITTLERQDERFEAAHLGKLAFAESSPDYSGRPFSIGFSGKPGGPDFYIDTGDSADASSPSSAMESEEQSYFGTVVSGREVLDRLMQRRGDPNIDLVFEIESVRLL